MSDIEVLAESDCILPKESFPPRRQEPLNPVTNCRKDPVSSVSHRIELFLEDKKLGKALQPTQDMSLGILQ